MDSYFSSTPVKLVVDTEALKTRWRAFQRLPHAIQAEEIDEILRRSRERQLTDEEFYLVQQWEVKRNPTLN